MAIKKSTSKNSTTKKVEEKKIVNQDDNRVKELEKTVSDLTAMVQLLLQQNNKTTNTVADLDRDVIFISLCNHILNLSTEPNGGGVIYTFYSFGEEQPIPYSDARKIIKNNKSFIRGGKCYIADDEIIQSEHLTNDYKKILSKEELFESLSSDRNAFKAIFNSMTEMQKEVLKDVVIDKLSEDRNSVDMNIVQHINESLGIDILKSIEYGKELLVQND